MSELSRDSITFGKYKGSTLDVILKDRNYCKWLLAQEWFQSNYSYLYNRVKEYDPKSYFLKYNREEIEVSPFLSTIIDKDVTEFLNTYTYFHLKSVEDIELPLTKDEKICYLYYLRMINELRDKILERVSNFEFNCFDIKAPVRWLKRFETETNKTRIVFKKFIDSHELPNIPYIVEDIKRKGGIEYKGAQSFNIAKKRSVEQEYHWELILKGKFGEDIGTQFKYNNCIFDFLNIPKSVIYECKLGLKDFNEEQHKKYILILDTYTIIYLIGTDCVVDIEKKTIFTSDKKKYLEYIMNIPTLREPSKFDDMIIQFPIEEVENVENYI